MCDNVLSKTICRFCSCDLFSNIYPKNNSTKTGSDQCNFYSKLDFRIFFIIIIIIKTDFCFSSLSLNNQCSIITV